MEIYMDEKQWKRDRIGWKCDENFHFKLMENVVEMDGNKWKFGGYMIEKVMEVGNVMEMIGNWW